MPIVYSLPHGNHDNFRLSILKLTGQWPTSSIFDYLRSPDSDAPLDALRILDTLLKQTLLPVNHCQGSFFYRNQSESDVHLPDGFELRLGFSQSLCLTQAGLTLNLQTTLTKFFPHMEILDFISVYLKKDVRKYGMTSSDYEKVKGALNGCKITTRQSNYRQVKTTSIEMFLLIRFVDLSNSKFFRYT